jgi:hypothetical protein
MKEKDKRPVYDPPRARDISASSVSGFPVPQGLCVTGTALVYPIDCITGSAPVIGACAPMGLAPEWGPCTTGQNVAAGCLSGGTP